VRDGEQAAVTRAGVRLATVAAVAVALMVAVSSAGAPADAAARPQRPCDIYAAAGTPCAVAYSSARALFARYRGALYQVRRASDGATRDIRVTRRGGYADAHAQDAFCAGTSCVVSRIYDQTRNHNTLTPQPPTTAPYSNTQFPHDPVAAGALPILAGGHAAYGLKFVSHSPTGLPCPTAATCIGSHGQAYANGHQRGRGVPVGAEPEHTYAVFGGTFTGADCCFDFGNSEVLGTDNGNGTMDALNFSRDCWNACGPGGGPWVQADLENGMFMTGQTTPLPGSITAFIGGSFESGAGFCCAATPKNLALPLPFVTAMLDNPGRRTFAIRGGDATAGKLITFYEGPTPPGKGYSPMRKEGAIILGSGGDQGTTDGEFFEGAVTVGIPSAQVERAIARNIAAVRYRMR
jgi:hypothetical protein